MSIELKNLSPQLERELAERAAETGKSVEQIAIEAVEAGLLMVGLDDNLRAVLGTWVPDPDFDAAVAEFGRVDSEKWQ